MLLALFLEMGGLLHDKKERNSYVARQARLGLSDNFKFVGDNVLEVKK